MSQSPDEVDLTTAIIARLREQCPGLVSVTEAETTEPIDNIREDTPCAQVYYAEDGATDETNGMQQRQTVSQVYGVWIVARVGEDYRAQRKAVRDALFGWQPEPGGHLMAYQGGKIEKILGGYRLWHEFWAIDVLYRAGRARTP